MLPALFGFAMVQQQMTKHAPGSRNFELDEQVEQSIDNNVPLDLTGAAKLLRPKEVKGSPNQLEVQTDCENPTFEFARFL
jgi:hypothetical protein